MGNARAHTNWRKKKKGGTEKGPKSCFHTSQHISLKICQGEKNQKHHVSIRRLVFTCDIYVRSSMQQTNAVCFSPNGRRRWWWRRKRGKETFNGPGANITTSYFAKKKLRGKKSFFLCAAAFFKCSRQHKEQFVVY